MSKVSSFDFSDLFVLDLANNHQGDKSHAINIINKLSNLALKHNIRAAVKFQFRELNSFIHPSHRQDKSNKHIGRFLSTELDIPTFRKLSDHAKDNSLIRICTPFDEASVDSIIDLGIEIIKVASCSAKDWPLLEKIAESGLPIIFSTGGLSIPDIDNVVSFFEHKACDFAIMHCVSVYPTPPEQCNLVQIDVLKKRYPGITIGWSTHEDPDNYQAVQIAYALGARMFERHVGISNEKYQLNAYSSDPSQLDKWVTSYKLAKSMYGSEVRTSTEVELKSIDSLSRGVFAKERIEKGTTITRDQIYFAMPYQEGQLTSGQWKKDIITSENIEVDKPVILEHLELPEKLAVNILKSAIHEVRAILNQANIALSSEFEVEISHHYGIKNFRDIGALIITCINREYCKKLLVQLPNQKHPNHYHKLKEETFQVLSGTLDIVVDGHKKSLIPGDCCLVLPGVWHSFSTATGVVVEEVSTTHYKDDSYYQDSSINKMESHERKTKVDHWGRYQMQEDNWGRASY